MRLADEPHSLYQCLSIGSRWWNAMDKAEPELVLTRSFDDIRWLRRRHGTHDLLQPLVQPMFVLHDRVEECCWRVFLYPYTPKDLPKYSMRRLLVVRGVVHTRAAGHRTEDHTSCVSANSRDNATRAAQALIETRSVTDRNGVETAGLAHM